MGVLPRSPDLGASADADRAGAPSGPSPQAVSGKAAHPLRVERIGRATLYLGDCLEILPQIERAEVIVTDPPYGMGKGEWDASIPDWLPLVDGLPTATFCGVVGQRDYPTPDWVGAWVRAGSTQRNGRLRGFNNWEPILFYNMPSLDNDVIACPNYHDDTGHPTTKPTPLMQRLLAKMPAGAVCDPFMGSGTTGVAAVQMGRNFIGVEKDQAYFDIACRRIEDAQRQLSMFVGEAA